MNQQTPKLRRLGPIASDGPGRQRRSLIKSLPWDMICVVGLPTLVAAVYFLFMATPRYVSETRFVVQSQERSATSSLGMVLQSTGLGQSASDAFAVHEYMTSRQAMADLNRVVNLQDALNRGDLFSRLDGFGSSKTNEERYKGYKRFVSVGYDSTNGISTLRVEAFRPSDAKKIAETLLVGGEGLVNRLNDRANRRAVTDAERTVEEHLQRLTETQRKMTQFRNEGQFIDPVSIVQESATVIGAIMSNLSSLKAERSVLLREAPQSPQLPILEGRIQALESQLSAERNRIAGDARSLAPQVANYEALVLTREVESKSLLSAQTALDQAREAARRQSLYLESIVAPNLPDKPTLPRRWLAILAVFATSLLIYLMGRLVWAALREHRQA